MSFPSATRVAVERKAPATSGPSLIFSAVFAVTYSLCFYFNWPLFAYYPQVTEFHLSADLQSQLGPPILWYGWLATAALVSGVATAVIPKRLSGGLWPGLAWAIPGGVILAILIYEKRWFF
jgi:hypothetical protein